MDRLGYSMGMKRVFQTMGEFSRIILKTTVNNHGEYGEDSREGAKGYA